MKRRYWLLLLCGSFLLSGGATVHAQAAQPGPASAADGPASPAGGSPAVLPVSVLSIGIQPVGLPIQQAGPEKGARELQIWTTGGYGVKGIALHTGVWTAGVRYGWVLTGPRGPGLLRGRFEYAVEAAPAFVVFQQADTAYGVAVSPLNLEWDFDAHRQVVPYAGVGAGSLFTNRQTPPGTSRANFTTSASLGFRFLTGKLNWSADAGFMHISDSGLTSANPGINVVQLRLGLGLYTARHLRR